MEPEEYASIYRLEQHHWWYRGMREVAEAWLDRYVQVRAATVRERTEDRRKDLSVLDAGCGTGGNLLALSRFGRVYGVDYSPLALRFCRERRLRDTARASVTHIPFRDARFDLVTSFEVLYHAAVADDVAAMREVYRVLVPGGSFLLRLPAFEFLRGAHDRTVHTRHRYTAPEVGEKLRRAGFEVLRLSYANSLLFPLAAASRVAQQATGRADRGGSDVRETTGWLNELLRLPLLLEARLLPLMDLPVGLSVLALARRPP